MGIGPALLQGERSAPRMILRCPRCSELKFFGRTQVLGELVVCPACKAVFRWGEAGTAPPRAGNTGPRDPEAKRTPGQRRKPSLSKGGGPCNCSPCLSS